MNYVYFQSARITSERSGFRSARSARDRTALQRYNDHQVDTKLGADVKRHTGTSQFKQYYWDTYSACFTTQTWTPWSRS